MEQTQKKRTAKPYSPEFRADATAVNDGMRIETGRRFYPEALGLNTAGLFGSIGAAARAPIRITADILDDPQIRPLAKIGCKWVRKWTPETASDRYE